MLKAVVFDFDGTLTHNCKSTWDIVKGGINYVGYYPQLMKGEIDLETWCELTTKDFQNLKLTKKYFIDATKQIKMVDGFDKVFKNLHKRNIEIHILSAGIKQIIEEKVKNNIDLVSSVQANSIYFKNDIIDKIVPTKCNMEGKAEFVELLMKEKHFKPEEVCFVGNDYNDEFVARTGCHTICINPENTNCEDKSIWEDYIKVCDDLTDIEFLLAKYNRDYLDLTI